MTKCLIVNGDDFGLTQGINQGILEAFENGIVRSASIMPVGNAFDNAVILARESPNLDIGIHLCLTEEKPVLAKEKIPTLVKKDGFFLRSHSAFIFKYILGKINLEDVEKELDMQIKKVLESGLQPTHIDSHGHIHMLPAILNIVAKLANKYNILIIRYPYDHFLYFKSRLSRKLISYFINFLCLLSKQNLKNKDFFKIEYFLGFLNSGKTSIESLRNIFASINSDTAELVCHPGRMDKELERYRHWRYAWEEELGALTSSDIKKMIKDLDIELINFRHLL